MNMLQANYFNAYRSLRLTRDNNGMLLAEFHSNGGPFTFTAQDHTELVDAFYRIAQDRANKVVIVTGAGGEFIPSIDFSSYGNVADPGVWSQVHDEGVQLLENLANIRVPLIAAIEGRAHVHSEYALLANVIVAAEDATFHDLPHFAGWYCSRRRNLYDVELSRRSGSSRGFPTESTSADGAPGP
jgi:enoyl-CoA hydratase/carnithine racemase